MTNWKSDDKRDFIRMSVDAEARVYIEGRSEALAATCRDLSATGVSLRVSDPVPPGTQLRVQIASPNAHLSAFDADAEVVHCEPEGQGHRLGVKITKMR
ncbi:PilZ domain-containing protein [Marinimicrobium alkaliphilum]|uniref:PilZ domain-containing protein n=1 Tax=Marinimicrobium alkaliphilum TaxID=2202654 RepID=UPI000DBAB107|nr:PilZ domain-containing protein [Marinimicrobium alkaliphilum]